jgi:hypothetical protein
MAPTGPGRAGAFAAMVGNDLMVSKDAPLPDVCVKCGAHSTQRRRQQFVWTPPWVIFLMILSLLIGAIVALIVQKRGTLMLPLCDQHARAWRNANIQIALAVVGVFLLPIVGGILTAANDSAVFVLLALVIALGALVAVAVMGRNARVLARKVDDTSITLTKVSPDAQRAIVAAFS